MSEAGMRKRWRPRAVATPPTSPDAQRRLAAGLRLHPLVAGLLVQRGHADPDAARAFLDPKLSALHDPALLPGLDAAARRLAQAVASGQPIVIYGDYDVDGVTASAILWHALTLAGGKVSTYVPHRIDEGYGLNCEAIAQLAQPDADGQRPLIISVDCGITAVEPAAVARKLGVDLIITDHHELDPGHLPEAFALVHPRLPGSSYPFGDLCGAGVAFKLAWRFACLHCGSDRVSSAFRDLLLDLLSLAALGTVADIVPLVDENRIITCFGLGQIKRTRFVGLNALIDASRLREEKVDAYHVGFVLGPRLNACGRMGHAREAVTLLTDPPPAQALEMAEFLSHENDRRRQTERQIFDEARRMVLEAGYDRDDCRAIVLGSEGWHAGVVGIVCSRLVEAFSRPVVLLSLNNGEAHGSARSIDGFSIHEAFTACSSHLTSFGGHAMAAGLRLPSDRLDAFRDDLVRYANQRLRPEHLAPVLDIDADCPLADLAESLFDQVHRLAPFGRANPAPVFVVRGTTLDRAPMPMGAQGQHLRLSLRQEGIVRPAVWFNAGDLREKLAAGVTLDVAFRPVIGSWQGRRQLEMHVEDARISDPPA